MYRTYGYESVAFTTSPADGELENALVFCVVKSWLRSPRLVSLPFSDHTDPLIADQAELSKLLHFLEMGQSEGNWKSVEFRPTPLENQSMEWDGFQDGPGYAFHRLDLHPSLEELFCGLHQDSIQRKIRRAIRDGVSYEEGRSSDLLDKFYRLTLLTRRRQALPPPPFAWFRNILDCLGDQAKIRLASKDGEPIAAILTLFYKQTLIYKYGASNALMHKLGGMPYLLWKAIEDGKQQGAIAFDLGRTDLGNSGLIQFKNRFGAVQSKLTYKKFPVSRTEVGDEKWHWKLAKRVFAALPDRMLILAGRLLYPHFG
ncbi:MAG: hypothetical protein PVS2B2_18880 [Candidatus Acidiferrum sp.]